MRLAYLVMAHQRPGQLARLVSHLKRSGDVFIHIDRKATERFYGLEECRVLPDPVAVYWSNWSHVVAEFNLAQAALPERYDYYCLLSGQCFPIKPLEHLEAYLRANAPAEHIRYIPAADWPECLVRFDKHFFEPRTLVARAVNRIVPHLPYKRELPLGLKPFNGWQWWALTHACMGHVVDAFASRWRDDLDELVDRVRSAMVPGRPATWPRRPPPPSAAAQALLPPPPWYPPP